MLHCCNIVGGGQWHICSKGLMSCVSVSLFTADAVSSSSTLDLSSATESAKGAASDLKSKAKSVLKGNSALPNSIATVADLNADVRGTAESYSDPAIAPVQDKIQGELGSKPA